MAPRIATCPANAATLAEAIPDATLRVIDDAGHLVFIECAEEVNDETISFLEPFERKPSWRLVAAQKARRLMQRTGETSEKVFSVFKSREPHETDDTHTTQITKKRRQRSRTTAVSRSSKDGSGVRSGSPAPGRGSCAAGSPASLPDKAKRGAGSAPPL